MTSPDREQLIITTLLRCLDRLEGGPALETILHAAVNLNLKPPALLSEFEWALRVCESRRWIQGLRTRLGNVKWSLTDAGKAALYELP